jgi:allophanate hydrolase subunit 1
MSVGVNMRPLAICRRLEEQRLDGVQDICASKASYLVRFDPDVLPPARARGAPARLEDANQTAWHKQSHRLQRTRRAHVTHRPIEPVSGRSA